jgi:hypothetical protein
VKKSLKPKGYGPDINTKVDTNVYEFGPITLTQMKGVFLLFILLFELLHNHYMNAICIYVPNVLHNYRVKSYLLDFYYFYINSNRVDP